ncbi:uncharacterized protein LOC115423507 [Sphaeramia orbicularis]|uniref:uncharacterized protein LOC115423507 n=1 Tax=Sphaeramia orbicularis TaxID=375764 RepID=UPI00117E69E8|nr:uncharacterized protein LOC115423507 [Sphaeramia orbicularis]
MRSNMMRALGLSSGVRTQKGPFGWICIIWFISALDVTVGDDVEVNITPTVVAKCGDNVTLTCEFPVMDIRNIMELYWMQHGNYLCKSGESQSANETQFLCHNTSEVNDNSILIVFNLTIMKIMPTNMGQYFCKMRSRTGSDSRTTVVGLYECIEESHHSVSESEAECTFSGVYPPGQVNWTLGDTELTDVITTQKEEADGRFTIKSKVKKQKANTNELYTCSLLRFIYPSEPMHVVSKLQFSGSGVVKLTWICMLVEMLLLILVIQF